jgi:Tol biopolymer transport system component
MTAFDRVEPRIPELLAELAPARVPDYFDTMLQRTARTRQRPAWSSLGRWLPMGVIARTAPARQVPWRPILLVALLGLLTAAALVVLAGANRPRLPAPFGPARNGLIATSVNGDVVTVDPATGKKTVLIAGPENDTNPQFSALGTKILFTRSATAGPDGPSTPGPDAALFMADADGSNVRQLVGSTPPIKDGWFDLTADGRRLVYTTYHPYVPGSADNSLPRKTWILDTATGTTTEGPSAMNPSGGVMWRPGHDEVLFRSDVSGRWGYYLAAADGSAPRAIAFPEGVARMSPDGSKLVYVQAVGEPGPLHTIDIDTGQDRLLTQPGDEHGYFNPQFSPDGTHILAQRYPPAVTDQAGDRVMGRGDLMLLPADGAGPVIKLGPGYDTSNENDFNRMQFSPDGTSVLAGSGVSSPSWMFDVAGGPGRQLDWSYLGGSAWQRLAP